MADFPFRAYPPANGAVEVFVRAAAIEIAPHRINPVSPTVFTESLAG
jgi:hypothetical protein